MKNMPSIFKLIGFFFLSFVLTSELFAQDENNATEVYEIITNDGNKYYGTISSEDEKSLSIETTSLGILTIKKENIKSKTKIDSNKYLDGEYWGSNIQSSRYFWGPNAFSLKRGEGYYQNIGVIINQVSVGLTDNFTLGVGLVPTFLVGANVTPVWFTPKFSFPLKKDKVSLGVGALVLGVLGSNLDNAFVSITYGMATVGHQDANFSIGLGYGYAGGEWANAPTVSASGMLRISKRTYLMTENYFVGNSTENIVLSIIGGRTVWENISLDYGLLVPISEILDGEQGTIGLPWVGLVIPFGKKG